MRPAAFFDLDGTLLAINSVALWVRRERRLGRLSARQALQGAVWMAAYRFGLVEIDRAVRAALATVVGLSEEQVRGWTEAWWRDEVAHHAAPGGLAVVEEHRRAGDLLVLLTSSSPYASEMARRDFGLDQVLCTRYEVADGCFTGRPVLPLCYGAGKVAHAERLAAEQDIDLARSAFYTDSCTDIPMLLRVGRPFAVNPDPLLRWEALRRGWPVLDWRQPVRKAG